MKYTIHGYSQEKSIESGLDYLDLGILRWIQDFYPAMKKTIFQNKEYGWFSYSYFLNELPIIGINTKAGLRKRIDKIIEKGFIERTCIKDADDKLGTRSWIRLTEKMLIIISQTTVSTGSNHSFHPIATTVSTGSNHSFHNSSINNSSINHSSISIDKDKDTASGFSQSENSISRKNGKIEIKTSEYGKTQIFCPCGEEFLDQILESEKYFCCECASIYSKDEVLKIAGIEKQKDSEIPNSSVSSKIEHTQKQKDSELKTKQEVQEFVSNFKAKEVIIDGVLQTTPIFSENEIDLITEYILRRKKGHGAKVKNTQKALIGVLNDILQVMKEIPLEIIFEQLEGVYVNCGTAGDGTIPWQTIKMDNRFKHLKQKPTFNNQNANTNTVREYLKNNEQRIRSFNPFDNLDNL